MDPLTGQPLDGTSVAGSAQITLVAAATSAELSAELAGTTITGSSTLGATGHTDVPTAGGAVSATILAGSPIIAPVDGAAAGLPGTMTGRQIADLNGGRLPVGVRSQQDAFVVGYTDTITPIIKVDTATSVVLGLDLRLRRTLVVTVPDRGSVPAGTVLETTSSATSGGVATGLVQAAELVEQRISHQVVGQVIPGLLVVFALVLLAFGLPKLFGNQRPPPSAGRTATGDGREGTGAPQRPAGSIVATDLAQAGQTRPPAH
jgi:high-affinity iron transporter